MRLGYENIMQYPLGYHGWLELHPEDTPRQRRVIAQGDEFPACRLGLMEHPEDKTYLGAPPESDFLSLSEVDAEYVLIQLYNNLCLDCIREAKTMNEYYREVERSPRLKRKLRLIGFGVHNNTRQVEEFREKYGVLFPLFPDEDAAIFSCLGQAAIPLAYLVRLHGPIPREVILVRNEFTDASRPFFEEVRRMVLHGR